MKAVVFDGALRLVTDRPEPVPAPGEARIQTILAGICNTDLEVVRGYADFHGVMGHEFVGLVDWAEDRSWIGRRVVGEINVGCGVCQTCRTGQQKHCPNRTALGIRGRDGTLAEFFCLPVANLHPVPVEVPDRAAVFVEPLAAACQLLEQVHVRPTDRAVVVGDGKLGLLAAQVLALTGCDLTVVGHHDEKLAILARRGIQTQLSGDGLEGADLVVECAGQPAGFHTAQGLVRPRGTLALKSTYHGLVEADLSRLVVDEVRVVGSRCGSFEAALRLLVHGLVDVTSLIHAEMHLNEAPAAFELATLPGVLKVLVQASPCE
jgi:threonine dehydrogenase-like Zn-dependent dehydrogenase